MMHQEPSLYSLFEGTPWSPSLPASSGTRNDPARDESKWVRVSMTTAVM